MTEDTPRIIGRITSAKLLKWINDKFLQLELHEYKAVKIERTHFNSNDYECGACRLYVRVVYKNNPNEITTFMCFYRLSDYEESLKLGYKMVLKDNGRNGIISQFEIDLIK